MQGVARSGVGLCMKYAHAPYAHAHLTRARATVCMPMGCANCSPGEEAAKVAASARAEKKRHDNHQNVQAQACHKLSRWEVEPRPRFPRY